ncbi:MAG: hypothetical protein LR015_06860 [Verrucomicrobia bacterium]|nr:hypothetical protein [Verrucomicrobiota bacterium]
MSEILSLGLIADFHVHYYRCIVEAAIKFSRRVSNIRFRLIERSIPAMLQHKDRERVDGVICQPLTPSEYELLRSEGSVVVNISTRFPPRYYPHWIDHVVTDDYKVGVCAAKHFKGVGLRNFAFFWQQ